MHSPAAEPAPTPDQPAAQSPLLWLIRGLAVCAAGVAGYLAVTSFLLKGLPVGCGSGSGCQDVLQSRWSALFGVPVGFFALAAYLGVLAATFFVRRGTLLLTLAVAVAASALCFIAIQLLPESVGGLEAVCPWCMGDHALGLAMAGTVFVFVSRLKTKEPAGGASNRNALLAGGGLAAAFILMLSVWGAGAQIARLAEDRNDDTGAGSADRRIGVLNGKLQVDVHDVPVLGSPDAATLVVILYDYCCPHCRRTHGYLVEGLERYGGQFGLLLLPMPLDEDCNRSILEGETEPRFEEACDLARLALAVWRADRSAFATYDAWLYEPEMPRSAAEARAEAESLVGAESLEAALGDAWIEERIAADVEAYIASGAETIPIVLSPGMAAVVGRPESAEELFGILEEELGLRTVSKQ